MHIQGSLHLVDSPHVSSFFGAGAYGGDLACYDSTHVSQITGYVVIDSTRYPPYGPYIQGSILRQEDPALGPFVQVPSSDTTTWDPTSQWAGGDPPLVLMDHTYAWGTLGMDGTYRDGTWMDRWYDPVWINYSLWYTEDASNPSLIGYRYRDPVKVNVGNYYVAMEVPRPTGWYEIRWRYQKTATSYAHEVVMPFRCMSAGIDSDRS